ncbi:MAG: 4-hydroxy-3-methylbut-2-enyl diphosphate reductase [Eubacteriales bacterium]|nr:4-hydroxy-3-methylbut-2-enyl diphosphate reductase [Eubacteriales bacterium]
MEILVAKSAGFCPGVKRAIKMARQVQAAEQAHLGPIVHNELVVEEFTKRGVRLLEDATEAKEGEAVVIRAHGVSPQERSSLIEKRCAIVDCTCPYVEKIHRIVKREAEAGKRIIIIGDSQHPEIRGIAGEVETGCYIIADLDEAAELLLELEKQDLLEAEFAVVMQTTFRKEIKDLILNFVAQKIANLRIFDTICYTTSERQTEAIDLAKRCDILLVLGSARSANTRKLLELCRKDCREAHLIQRPDQVPALFTGRDLRHLRIGITAGASTPERMIREVIRRMTDQEKQISELQQDRAESAKRDLDVAPLDPAKAENLEGEIDVKECIEENQKEAEGATGEKITHDAIAGLENEAPAPVEESPAAEPSAEGAAKKAEQTVTAQVTANSEFVGGGKSEKKAEVEEDINFEDFIDSIPTLKTGTIVKGRIIRYDDEYVYIDVKDKSEGKVPRHEFTGDLEFDIDKAVAEHSEMDVYVRSIRNSDMGKEIVLSKAKVDFAKHKEAIEEAYNKKVPVTVTVTNVVKDGVIGSFGSVDLYIHRTQLDHQIVENLEEWRGKTFEVLVTQFDTNRRRLRVSGSRRALIQKERRKQAKELWENIEVGQEYDGVVRNLTNFGAFVDIGGVDGLVHITELSWERIHDPAQVVSIGDVLRVYIIDFDKEKKRISLGFKRPENDPYYQIEERFPIGTIVRGIVVRMLPFGAFVEIAPGVDALCHISQISNFRLNRPEDVLQEGMEVDARVLEASNDERKISISIREVEPIDPPEDKRQELEQQQQRDRRPRRRRRRDDQQREEGSSDYIDQAPTSTLAGLASLTVASEEGTEIVEQIEKEKEEAEARLKALEEERIAKQKAQREAEKKAAEEAEKKAAEEAEKKAAEEAEKAEEPAEETAEEASAETAEAEVEATEE